MSLSVGDLAKRSGLTIRTLHHYDAIGLLKPSGRSAAGYRLYDQDNVQRLLRIQALRQLGLSLADIGIALSGPQAPLTALIDRQLAQLEAELQQAQRLKTQLLALRGQLAAGQQPDMALWLETLAMMSLYQTYFSNEELQHLPLLTEPSVQAQWIELVASIQALIDAGVAPDDARARELALRWMQQAHRDTDGHADLLGKLDDMHAREPSVQDASGITPALHAYVRQAIIEARLAIYARYLSAEELAFARQHYGKHMDDWPTLIAALHREMERGTPPSAEATQTLARQWMVYFSSYAGTDPATHAKFRQAHAESPELMAGSFVDAPLLAYLRDAFAHRQA